MAIRPAGWYEHPSTPGVRRYWDGRTWVPPGQEPAEGSEPTILAAQVPVAIATAPTALAPPAGPPPSGPPPHMSPLVQRGWKSARVKVFFGLLVVGIGLGGWWAIGEFFGADYSFDGAIEVDTPFYWHTISVTNPDFTYAADGAWLDVSDTVANGPRNPEAQLLSARALSTDLAGTPAILVVAVSKYAVPDFDPSRDVLSGQLDHRLDVLEAKGIDVLSREETLVLRSDSGRRWGFVATRVSTEEAEMDLYVSLAFLRGRAVEFELWVPDDVALTRDDLLAVVNSIEVR